MEKKMKKVTAFFLSLIMVLGIFVSYPPMTVEAAEDISLSGMAHVQNVGDMPATVTKEEGIDTLVLGTRGRSQRVERITVNLENNTGITGGLEYKVHIQNEGWTDWIPAGSPAGTQGKSYRLEAIQIRLTGYLQYFYDVRYCAHIQNYGDAQGWMYNGAVAGTFGESLRLEEIKVQIVPKESISTTPTLNYRVHRQDYGWEKTWTKDGGVSGTVGQSKRLEGITITVNDNVYNGGIRYKTHIQNIGWQDWMYDGYMSGTQGKSYRLEAIKIELTGDLQYYYDVYYRVHAQNYGWLGWAKNGEASGTEGGSLRLEAIQIVLKPKGSSAPSATYNGVTSVKEDAYYKVEQKPAETTPVVPASGSYNDAYANQVLTIVNQQRAANGLPALTMNEKACNAAKVRAKEIVESFSHTRPDGRTCFTALPETGLSSGIDYWAAGENIAAGQQTPTSVMDAWMNSSGHRANILSSDFTEIGIACYTDPNAYYRIYWVQMFIGK